MNGPKSLKSARLDFVTMHIFLMISIRATSENLNLSPSAVSRRLADLEELFGQSFFHRHSRGVEITEAGQIMVTKVRDIFDTIDSTHMMLRRLDVGEAGTLILSANGSAFVNGLAQDLKESNDHYPHIDIDLLEEISPTVVASVLSGKAELGVIARTFRLPSDIETVRYCVDRLVLVVPKGHLLAGSEAVTLADISSHPTIGVIEGSSMTRLVRRVSMIGKSDFDFRYMASTNEVARMLVAHGHGITILPEQFVRPYTAVLPIESVPISEPWAERELSLIHSNSQTLSKTAAIFRDFLGDRAAVEGVAE